GLRGGERLAAGVVEDDGRARADALDRARPLGRLGAGVRLLGIPRAGVGGAAGGPVVAAAAGEHAPEGDHERMEQARTHVGSLRAPVARSIRARLSPDVSRGGARFTEIAAALCTA